MKIPFIYLDTKSLLEKIHKQSKRIFLIKNKQTEYSAIQYSCIVCSTATKHDF